MQDSRAFLVRTLESRRKMEHCPWETVQSHGQEDEPQVQGLDRKRR